MIKKTDNLALKAAVLAIGLTLAIGAAPPAAAGAYKQLSSEDDIPQLAALHQVMEALPRVTHDVEVPSEDGRGTHRIAVEEIGARNGDQVAVLVHGVLSDRSTWRFVAADLGQDHNVLAIDLLGCGDSDRPHPKTMGRKGYGPTANARRTWQVLEAMMAARVDAPRLVLVGHSLGGAIVLRMMGDPELREAYGSLVERVDGVVLISPLDLAMEKVHPTFAKISSLGKFEVRIGSTLGVLKKQIAKSASRGHVDPETVSREDVDRLRRILKQGKVRRPAKAMILQAVPFDPKTHRPNWEEIERFTADYDNVDAPVLILCGARDETLPASMGFKLRAQLPDARLRILRLSMHSPQVEHPVRTAGLVREFADSRGQGWAPFEELEPEGRPQLLAELASK